MASDAYCRGEGLEGGIKIEGRSEEEGEYVIPAAGRIEWHYDGGGASEELGGCLEWCCSSHKCFIGGTYTRFPIGGSTAYTHPGLSSCNLTGLFPWDLYWAALTIPFYAPV